MYQTFSAVETHTAEFGESDIECMSVRLQRGKGEILQKKFFFKACCNELFPESLCRAPGIVVIVVGIDLTKLPCLSLIHVKFHF